MVPFEVYTGYLSLNKEGKTHLNSLHSILPFALVHARNSARIIKNLWVHPDVGHDHKVANLSNSTPSSQSEKRIIMICIGSIGVNSRYPSLRRREDVSMSIPFLLHSPLHLYVWRTCMESIINKLEKYFLWIYIFSALEGTK